MEWKCQGFMLLCAFPHYDVQDLSQQVKAVRGYSAFPESQKCCSSGLAGLPQLLTPGAACHGLISLTALHSCGRSWHAIAVLQLWSDACFGSQHTWPTPTCGFSGNTMGKKTKIHHAKQGDNCQKYPGAYVAMVHTVSSTAHKHNQVLTTLAVLLPSCPLVFLYTYW